MYQSRMNYIVASIAVLFNYLHLYLWILFLYSPAMESADPVMTNIVTYWLYGGIDLVVFIYFAAYAKSLIESEKDCISLGIEPGHGSFLSNVIAAMIPGISTFSILSLLMTGSHDEFNKTNIQKYHLLRTDPEEYYRKYGWTSLTGKVIFEKEQIISQLRKVFESCKKIKMSDVKALGMVEFQDRNIVRWLKKEIPDLKIQVRRDYIAFDQNKFDIIYQT